MADEHLYQTWTWEAAKPKHAVNLTFQFSYARTRFVPFDLTHIDESIGVFSYGELIAKVVWAESVEFDAHSPFRVRVYFQGDLPIVTEATWGFNFEPLNDELLALPSIAPSRLLDDAGEVQSRFGTRTSGVARNFLIPTSGALDDSGTAGLSKALVDDDVGSLIQPSRERIKALFASRKDSIQARHRVELFFYDLDVATDVGLLDVNMLRNSILAVQEELATRLVLRGRCGRADRQRRPNWSASQSVDFVEHLQRVVQVVQRAFERFDDDHPSLSEERLCQWPTSWTQEGFRPVAFDAFVAGRLAVTHPVKEIHKKLISHGSPNGGLNFLMFAELIHLCRDNGIGAGRLEAERDVFVRMAHAFAYFFQSKESNENESAYPDGTSFPITWLHDLTKAYDSFFGSTKPIENHVFEDVFTYFTGFAMNTKKAGPNRPCFFL
ncbi:MAG: hypothetical protein ACI87A_002668 [Planctomycetota bacterium]|jgi:hypothetical protein